MNDKKIFFQLKKGNEHALERLIYKYSGYLACIIRNIGRDSLTREDVEELVADSFVSFWKNIDKFDFKCEEESLKGYLAAIARNNTINEVKRRKIEYIPFDEDVLYFNENKEDAIIKKEMESAVRNCILEMDEPDKSIFIFRYFYFLKTHEIAKKLFMKQKTVETRLLRGREKLKKLIIERGIEL